MSGTVRHAHLHHTSLWQPREPAFWIFVTFVVYGAWRMASVLTDLSTAHGRGGRSPGSCSRSTRSPRSC